MAGKKIFVCNCFVRLLFNESTDIEFNAYEAFRSLSLEIRDYYISSTTLFVVCC